jgi:Ran GTPase-activating protein (RanGAP) involved in mRNA processing and transport
VAPADPACPLLETLDVSHNGIGDEGVRLLLTPVLSSKAVPLLMTLRLVGCGLGPEGGVALADALSCGHVAQLHTLDLGGNSLFTDGVVGLAKALGRRGGSGQDCGCCPCLTSLHLTDNAMRAKGAAALADAIGPGGALAGLTLLDVEGNLMGEQGIKALVAAWARHAQGSSDGEGQEKEDETVPVDSSSSNSSSRDPSFCSSFPPLPLETLRLARNYLGDLGCEHLRPLLSLCPRLRVLDLGLNGLPTQSLAHLFSHYQTTPATQALRLENLDMAGNRLTPPGICAMTRAARNGYLLNLKRLGLEGCYIEAAGALELSAALVASPTLPAGGLPALETLCLGCNRLSSQGVASLAVAMSGGGAKSLTRLGLNGNNLTDAGATALASAISNDACPALRHLELYGNSVQSEGLRRLAVAFRSRSRLLQTLDLGRPSQGPVGIQALGAYFLAAVMSEGAFPALTHLHLGGNGIGRSGVYMLHIALRNQTCKHLESLDLDGNNIGDIGGSYLAIAFRRGGCPGLRTLRLGSCGLRDAGLSRIVHAFIWRRRDQRRITTLNLTNNNISADGFAGLFSQVRVCADSLRLVLFRPGHTTQ